MKAALRAYERTQVDSMRSHIRPTRVTRPLKRWGSGDWDTSVDEFRHEVKGAVFGFRATRARGERRTQCVEHRSHLVADVAEVTSPGKPSVIKLHGKKSEWRGVREHMRRLDKRRQVVDGVTIVPFPS
jgi:hypothetical protein